MNTSLYFPSSDVVFSDDPITDLPSKPVFWVFAMPKDCFRVPIPPDLAGCFSSLYTPSISNFLQPLTLFPSLPFLPFLMLIFGLTTTVPFTSSLATFFFSFRNYWFEWVPFSWQLSLSLTRIDTTSTMVFLSRHLTGPPFAPRKFRIKASLSNFSTDQFLSPSIFVVFSNDVCATPRREVAHVPV